MFLLFSVQTRTQLLLVFSLRSKRLMGRREKKGAFHSTKNSGDSRLGSQWNRIKRARIVKMASQHTARRVCLSPKAYSSYSSMNDCSSRSFVLTSESSNNCKSRKRGNMTAICFALLVQTTGKYCSIRHTKYPEFQTGIFGRMESA